MKNNNLQLHLNNAVKELRNRIDSLDFSLPDKETRQYTASLIHGDKVYSRIFTYSVDKFFDFDALLKELIVEAGVIDSEVRLAELIPCSMDYIINPNVLGEYDIRTYINRYPGLSVNPDRTSITIPGKMVRVKRPAKTTWQVIDDVTFHFSCIGKWENPAKTREWLNDSIKSVQNLQKILEDMLTALTTELEINKQYN